MDINARIFDSSSGWDCQSLHPNANARNVDNVDVEIKKFGEVVLGETDFTYIEPDIRIATYKLLTALTKRFDGAVSFWARRNCNGESAWRELEGQRHDIPLVLDTIYVLPTGSLHFIARFHVQKSWNSNEGTYEIQSPRLRRSTYYNSSAFDGYNVSTTINVVKAAKLIASFESVREQELVFGDYKDCFAEAYKMISQTQKEFNDLEDKWAAEFSSDMREEVLAAFHAADLQHSPTATLHINSLAGKAYKKWKESKQLLSDKLNYVGQQKPVFLTQLEEEGPIHMLLDKKRSGAYHNSWADSVGFIKYESAECLPAEVQTAIRTVEVASGEVGHGRNGPLIDGAGQIVHSFGATAYFVLIPELAWEKLLEEVSLLNIEDIRGW